ncbi:MAG: galactokinase [Chthoniobacterales bacterium]|nr:MAG: galactokinase [Chthoniobacterales bacterium]
MSEIEAIILAGGKGTRLRTVVSDRPKVMAMVNERPFLSRLLDQLKRAQIKSVVLSTGYMAEQIESAIGESYDGISVRYSREAQPLGTAGGLRLALGKTVSEPVLVLNGDSFCAVDLEEFYQYHCAKNARATILLTQVEDTSRFGRVETDDRGSVIKFEEKGGVASPGWINAGVYCLDRNVVEDLPQGEEKSLEREVFPELIGSGLFGFRGGGDFVDIGTPQSYGEAQTFFEPRK